MGNAIARENGSGSGNELNGARSESGDVMQEATAAVSNGGASRGPHGLTVRVGSADMAMISPPRSPPHFNSAPLVFNPQVPVAPLQSWVPPLFNQMQRNAAVVEGPPVRGLPILITWSHGGNDVAVEGSWDNWRSRRTLQRAGKDHTLLLVLPCGLHRYRFIVDGEMRHILDLPREADPTGRVCNLLDVQDYTPDNCDGVKEFEVPGSPESSYGQNPLTEDDFAKEPLAVPPQLDQTFLVPQAIAAHGEAPPASSVQKPPHVVLDHLFVEKGWASQSVLALGLTHRFQQKYVTVVLYKPIKR